MGMVQVCIKIQNAVEQQPSFRTHSSACRRSFGPRASCLGLHLGFRVWDFRVQGLGFRVLGFRVPNLQVSEESTPGSEFGIGDQNTQRQHNKIKVEECEDRLCERC